MKLSEYAKQNSVTYRTAWNWYKAGKIPNARQLQTGTVVIDDTPNINMDEYTVIYCRVSSAENKSNLDSQADRLTQFCMAKGWTINQIVKECASGLNDQRPKLTKILTDRKATRIVVEHKDRLTRFGFNYIKVLYPECDIVVVNECEDNQDLMEDFISVITSFCARIYGKRRTQRKTEAIIKTLNEDDENVAN